MNREEQHVQDVNMVRLFAKLTDMLEYASWDYPDDATEARNLVKEADEFLAKIRRITVGKR